MYSQMGLKITGLLEASLAGNEGTEEVLVLLKAAPYSLHLLKRVHNVYVSEVVLDIVE
jgi:hypothetical protein